MMSGADILQIGIYVASLTILTPLLGRFMASVFDSRRHILSRPLGWMERGIYAICGVNSAEEHDWRRYTKDLLVFNFLGFLVVFLLHFLQPFLPLNPQHFGATSWHLAFNTAVSFVTNTNWQSYSGETTLSYLTQMLGLTVQNFLSAATGIAVMLAFVRGIRGKSTNAIGNFWVDMVRCLVYVLLPLSLIFSVFLVGQGVVQNLRSYPNATGVEGVSQTLPMGPAASQIAIKQLGSNGGGFFNANSAHPFENPTPLCNFFEMLSILLIPSALVYTFAMMVGSVRHGRVVFAVMLVLWLIGLAVSLKYEFALGPMNMEGKEVRFGVANSVLWSTATTVTSNGSVNAMHSSLSPISGLVALFNVMLGEVVFGGVGSGMYGMLLHILLTVFLAGLLVGRSPEYLGKKIEAREMKWVILAILIPNAAILAGAAAACVLPAGLTSLSHKGPHGLSEILYAFSSAAGNNGSAFAGLNANTLFYNVTLGVAMLVGRFGVIVPCLAIAGSLAAKKVSPGTAGTFPVDGVSFGVLLTGTLIIVGVLSFLPALCLGPLIEHLLGLKGVFF